MRVRVRDWKKEEVHWTRSKAKKRRARRRQAVASGRRCTWRLWWVAARCVRARRSQRGWASNGRVSWGPGGAGRAVRGQLAAGENAGDGQEEEDEDVFVNFTKVQGV
jgi:hypothetical protein